VPGLETYYRREWRPFLAASVGLVRSAFGMSWPRTLVGAWLVLRANQVWAPYPNNDPEAARNLMTRFYQLLRKSTGESFHPGRAAWLEVEWWRVHREAQHGEGAGPSEELTMALRDLYAYSYSVDPADVQPAAALRAEAMDVSDRWVEGGCDPEDLGWRRSAHCSCAPMRVFSPPYTTDHVLADDVDAVLAGDMTAALAYLTPAGGAVVTAGLLAKQGLRKARREGRP